MSVLGSQNQMSRGNTLLIIDDDTNILKTLEMFLTKEHFSVDTAESGAEAIRKSKEKAFDLALIDIVLPDMQGTQLLTELVDGSKHRMRKIMLTGNANLENAILTVNLGADAYLRKPVKMEDLRQSIEDELLKQLDEDTITTNKIIAFLKENETDLVAVVKKSLNSVLGEPLAQTTIFHLGGESSLSNPRELEQKMRSFFDLGADIFLKEILKNLEATTTPPADK